MQSYVLRPNPPSWKNSRKLIVQNGRRYIVPSTQAAKWMKSAIIELKSQHRGAMIDIPIAVKFLVFSPNRIQRDLTNMIQGPEDALVKAGCIKDDSLIKSLDGSRILLDRLDPRVEIKIRPFETKPGGP